MHGGPEAGRDCVETASRVRDGPNAEPYTARGSGTSGETNRSQCPGPQQEGEPPCSALLSRLMTI
jgi:hypothetical protein